MIARHAPLVLGATTWDWSRPYLLGVVNVTPDSFSDGGVCFDPDHAIAHGLRLVDEGADALDLGGESTRPGAPPVSEDEELRRVVPVVAALAARARVPLSIDTTKARVAREALAAGAHLVNDVGTGDGADALGREAARAGAAYVVMHARGTPATMAQAARYDDLHAEVVAGLRDRVATVLAAGVAPTRVLVDPGIGFAKTGAQSLALLAHLAPLRALGYPLLVGASRKSFIVSEAAHAEGSWPVDASPAGERLGGTAAAVTVAVMQGAEVLRVHDVAVMRQAARLAQALRSPNG
jgi:dihydropteroate synthase